MTTPIVSHADLATLVARFAAALRAEGLAVGADRSARFATAIRLLDPETVPELRSCALATLTSAPGDIEILDRVFAAVFGGLTDPAIQRGQSGEEIPRPSLGPSTASGTALGASAGAPDTRGTRDGPETRLATSASWAERLAARDFADLTDAELAALAELMRKLRFGTPPRRSRRYRPAATGHRYDIRESLRRARRTGGQPLRLRRRAIRTKRRKLVVLCDISGSMQAYARALLQLLFCATGGAHAEVFTFATRLTRLTPALSTTRPDRALARAGRLAPDWSGGTRIGASLGEFLRRHGARGLARGAVVVIVSDGWDTGQPDVLAHHLARLSRVAFRIVWANPRTASPRYRPLVGGMAVAWPYCDAVVSAHRLDALDALITAIADPIRRRPPESVLSSRTHGSHDS